MRLQLLRPFGLMPEEPVPTDAQLFPEGKHDLRLDPEVLALELAEELAGDPLDELLTNEPSEKDVFAECNLGLELLNGNDQERMQALRIFCEHRDPRASPLLQPLLQASCPITRMSAVYALGRNLDQYAIEKLLSLLQFDDNGYVRKAVAWSLGNYKEPEVFTPLIRALRADISAVRLWAASSLADVGANVPAQADSAATQLIETLRIDSEPAVRCNSAWALGRLYPHLVEQRQKLVVEALLESMLNDIDRAVRDDARMALEQIEEPEILQHLQMLVEEGILS